MRSWNVAPVKILDHLTLARAAGKLVVRDIWQQALTDENLQTYMALTDPVNEQHYVVCNDEGLLLGVAGVLRCSRRVLGVMRRLEMRVLEIAVAPEARGQDIGSNLLAAVARDAQAAGASVLTTDAHAPGFFARAGFRPVAIGSEEMVARPAAVLQALATQQVESVEATALARVAY